MCASYPKHKDDGQIAGKVMMIGRIYSASIERRKNKKNSETNADFYLDKVVPALKKSHLDRQIDEAKAEKYPTLENAHVFIAIHWKLSAIFEELTDQTKRSLASKYLHFHVPEKFFIFDSRAKKAVNDQKINNQKIDAKNEIKHIKARLGKTPYDTEYLTFFAKCLVLRSEIKRMAGNGTKTHLTPRELDKFLLNLHR